MNLIVIYDEQDFISKVANDAQLISTNTYEGNISGMTVFNTYLIGMSEDEFKNLNPKLYTSIKVAMLASGGRFIYAEKTV